MVLHEIVHGTNLVKQINESLGGYEEKPLHRRALLLPRLIHAPPTTESPTLHYIVSISIASLSTRSRALRSIPMRLVNG